MVLMALSKVGKENKLACNTNPIKLCGSEKPLPCLGQMLDGWRQLDGPVLKKIPVEADVPEDLVKLGLQPTASAIDKAVGDLVAFYYLLRIGEYTIKGAQNESKQTQQFKMADVTIFKRDPQGTSMLSIQGPCHVSG
jgi:hypothetical protein